MACPARDFRYHWHKFADVLLLQSALAAGQVPHVNVGCCPLPYGMLVSAKAAKLVASRRGCTNNNHKPKQTFVLQL